MHVILGKGSPKIEVILVMKIEYIKIEIIYIQCDTKVTRTSK